MNLCTVYLYIVGSDVKWLETGPMMAWFYDLSRFAGIYSGRASRLSIDHVQAALLQVGYRLFDGPIDQPSVAVAMLSSFPHGSCISLPAIAHCWT